MYVLAKGYSIVALNAATGKEIWRYAPDPAPKVMTHRGINYWQSKDGAERRLLFASDHKLRALDAKTGKLITTFGDGGAVDLKQGLDRDPAALTLVQATTPGRVFEDRLIVGSATNQGYGSAPGDIRAFDVRTGKLIWKCKGKGACRSDFRLHLCRRTSQQPYQRHRHFACRSGKTGKAK